MNNVYFGLNNVAEKPSKIYVGDSNGVARKVKKAYLGVNGVAKQVYSEYVNPLDDWDYTINGSSIYLNYYKGSDTDVTVHSTYVVEQGGGWGIVLNTKISESPATEYLTGKYMFNASQQEGCLNIKSITFENGVDTSSLRNWARMFQGCSSLENIYGLEYLNTSSATRMSSFFSGTKMLDFSGIANWNTSNLTSTYAMFAGIYPEVQVIDLTNWNTAQVTNMQYMFYNSQSIGHIYVGNGWNVSNVTSSSDMFTNCVRLPYYDSRYVDKTKAYVGNGGYLERKS